MTREKAVALALALCKATYPNVEISEETHTAWCTMLADIAPEYICAAVTAALRESRIPALPALGRVREIALYMAGEYIPPSRAYALVRARVRERMSADGMYRYSVDLSGLPERFQNVVRETIQRFGVENIGRSGIGVQARFERIYREVFSESFYTAQALPSGQVLALGGG